MWDKIWGYDWDEPSEEQRRAKEDFEEAKKDWEKTTGRKYTSDWYENFNWEDFLGEESVNIDECYKTLGLCN